MKRSLTAALVIAGVAFSVQRSSLAQVYYPPVFYPRVYGPPVFHPPSDPVHAPIEIGGHAAAGGGADAAPKSGRYIAGTVGLYAQWNRYGFCPGLDVRVQGNTSEVHGYLIGPRMAYQPRGRTNPFRLYAEGLFGKDEIPGDTANTALIPASGSRTGVTRALAVGLDLHSDSPFAWRVIEFTKGDFTGIPGSHPQTIMTGIVLHLP